MVRFVLIKTSIIPQSMSRKTTLLSFIFFLFAVTGVQAQAALLVLIFGDKVASEKFHLSIDGGLNVSSLPGLKNQEPTLGFNFGLGTFIKLNEKWALTPEFKPLSPRGAKNVQPLNDYSSVLSDVSYDFKLNYIDVPVLAQYKIKPKLFISAGPQVSFLTSANQVSNGQLQTDKLVDVVEDMESDFESIYLSIPVEIGYSLSNARKGKGVDLKVRYNIGMTEMFSNTAYGSSNGSTFQIFLSFPFIAEAE
jgi:hypothetical protein